MPSESSQDEIQVLDYLKQRFPFLMVDKVLSWEKGGVLKAVKNISINEPQFQGHFPGFPVFPGVLTIECFAQAAAILVRLTEMAEGTLREDLFDVIGSVMDFRFLKPLRPGDRMETSVAITKTMGHSRIVEGRCFVGDTEVASGKLLFGKIEKT
ncbi:MAG TPA: 3-hydroxyacyl-ACP dehydratase FabZ [bacterium]|jgi:3-hydroxyacyl-[acyl-carrier-protein] dehydratase|nr:3-hydroxyacyl-ACP dehydratase FabZ [bacterium]